MDDITRLRHQVERQQLVLRQLIELIQAAARDIFDEPYDLDWFQGQLEGLHDVLTTERSDDASTP